MTPEEFSKSLTFTQIERDTDLDPHIELKGKFELQAKMKISMEAIRFTPGGATEIISHATKHMRHELLMTLYEDRTRELMEAVRAIYIADPFGYEFSKARSEFLRVAMRQPSADIRVLMNEIEKDETIRRLRDRVKELETDLARFHPRLEPPVGEFYP